MNEEVRASSHTEEAPNMEEHPPFQSVAMYDTLLSTSNPCKVLTLMTSTVQIHLNRTEQRHVTMCINCLLKLD